MNEKFKLFYELIQNSNSIVIAGHISPDCDAISASFSLASFILKIFNKKSIVLLEEYPEKYSFLKGKEFLYNKQDYKDLSPDLFIAVDCGSIDRLGEAKSVFERSKKTVNIDHHISNDSFAQVNFVDPKSSSTSQIIFEILKDLDVLDDDIATTIYSGIVFDTCGFKHNSTSSRTHQIASELLNYNIDISMVHTKILNHNTLAKAKVLSKAIENIVVYKDFCYSILNRETIINECSADYSDVEGISSYLLDIEGINIAVFFYEYSNSRIKVSLRSKKIDVNKIASIFNGGGHKLASGAILKTSLEEAVKLVTSEVNKYLI